MILQRAGLRQRAVAEDERFLIFVIVSLVDAVGARIFVIGIGTVERFLSFVPFLSRDWLLGIEFILPVF